MKNRIWELDAVRGICILGVIAVHFIFDITQLYGIVSWHLPQGFLLLQQWGGVIFVLLSGICATLGSHSVKRGLVVFGCGLLCTAVTAGMYWLNMAGSGIIIYFGVLHCLGICMILWHFFKKQHWISLLSLGAALVAIGLVLNKMRSTHLWLMPLGLITADFAAAYYRLTKHDLFGKPLLLRILDLAARR